MEINLYRVRRSFNDIKSQKGAFFTLEAAVITANKYGLNVYNSDGRLLFSAIKKARLPMATPHKEVFM